MRIQKKFQGTIPENKIDIYNQLYLFTNVAWDSALSFKFILEYTKTTDA